MSFLSTLVRAGDWIRGRVNAGWVPYQLRYFSWKDVSYNQGYVDNLWNRSLSTLAAKEITRIDSIAQNLNTSFFLKVCWWQEWFHDRIIFLKSCKKSSVLPSKWQNISQYCRCALWWPVSNVGNHIRNY